MNIKLRDRKNLQDLSQWLGILLVAITVFFLVFFLESYFKPRFEPEAPILTYSDENNQTKRIEPSGFTTGLLEQQVESPITLEMKFPECRPFDRYRLWVGTHGDDSTLRQPSVWRVYVGSGQGKWQFSGSERKIGGYNNGQWYGYSLNNQLGCVDRIRFEVEEISGSNILRIYKFQVYESSFIERMVDAVVQNFSFAGTLIGFLSYIIGVLAMVPGYEKVLNPALAVIVSVVIIQASVSGWGHSIANRMLFLRTSSIKKDIFCALLSGLGYLSIFTTIYSLGLDRVITWISDFAVNRLHSYSINIDTGLVVIDIVLYLLAFTFVDYWQHRITHTSILWPLHRFHHSGSEFNGLTVFRNHPATFATDPVLRLALLAFLPMPARVSEYWPIVSLLFWSHQMLTHTDVDWKFGWIGKWIFVSPALHKVHHSKESEHYNKNFGTLFTVWDHVFGTYHEVPTARIEMGLTGEGDAISKKWIIWEWMIDVKNLFTGRYLRSVSWSARASFLKP